MNPGDSRCILLITSKGILGIKANKVSRVPLDLLVLREFKGIKGM